MIWIKASDRLPVIESNRSLLIFAREVIGGRKKLLWFGNSSMCLLKRYPHKYEWLDENYETDFTKGYNACKEDILTTVNKLTPITHPK